LEGQVFNKFMVRMYLDEVVKWVTHPLHVDDTVESCSIERIFFMDFCRLLSLLEEIHCLYDDDDLC